MKRLKNERETSVYESAFPYRHLHYSTVREIGTGTKKYSARFGLRKGLFCPLPTTETLKRPILLGNTLGQNTWFLSPGPLLYKGMRCLCTECVMEPHWIAVSWIGLLLGKQVF